MPVKDASIPKVKIDSYTFGMVSKAYKKWRGANRDLRMASFVRDALIEKSCKELGVTQRKAFPWLFED